jgi:hypothetical protein
MICNRQIQVLYNQANKMKSFKKYSFIVLALFPFGRSIAMRVDKSLNGVYLSHDDYVNDVLTEPSQSDADLLEELYAYRNNDYCDISFGRKVLLHNYGYYKILDCTGLIIYNQRVPYPFWLYVEEPYFNTDLGSKKYPLSIYHLKKHAHLTHTVVKELRWFEKHTSSLAEIVNDRTILNILLATRE